MSATNLNIVTINRRMLSLNEAAQYLGIPSKKFPIVCSVQPVQLANGIARYDRNALDTWLDALSSGDCDNDDDLIAKLS